MKSFVTKKLTFNNVILVLGLTAGLIAYLHSGSFKGFALSLVDDAGIFGLYLGRRLLSLL